MAFNDLTSRADLEGGIPKPIIGEIFEGIKKSSLVGSAFRTYQLPAGTVRMPVMDVLPVAQWQNPAETGLGQSTEVRWANKELTVETMQVFVPVPRAVLEDSQFDVWSQIMPSIVEAIGHKLDQAVLFGTYAPSSFPASVYSQVTAASALFTANTTAANGGLAEDLNKADEKINLSGYNADYILAGTALKNKIRRARATDGQRFADLAVDAYEGMPIVYGANSGLFPNGSGQPLCIMIDSSQYVLGIRRDIDMKLMEEAVITDNAGRVIYNSATQDGVVLRVTFRAGWQVANAVTLDSQNGGINEVVTLTQSGLTSGATQTFTFGEYSTAALDREATDAEVKAALEGLTSIGKDNVNVTRSGSAGARVYTVTFVNALGSKDVGAITAASSAGSITVAVATAGAAGARCSAAALVAA